MKLLNDLTTSLIPQSQFHYIVIDLYTYISAFSETEVISAIAMELMCSNVSGFSVYDNF
jgi:hypothetical protein